MLSNFRVIVHFLQFCSLSTLLIGLSARLPTLFSFPLHSRPLRIPFPVVRRHISDEIKEMAIAMSLQGICDAEVSGFTGISPRSLKQLRSTHRRIFTVSCKPIDPGRPRTVLTSVDVNVCLLSP